MPIKMATFIYIIGLTVLLVFSKLCETLSYDSTWKFANRYNRLDHIDTFSDVGFVQLEVPGKHYVVTGSDIYVQGLYGDSNLQLITSTHINIHTDNQTRAPNVIPDSDDGRDFMVDLKALSVETYQFHDMSSKTLSWLSGTHVQYLNMRFADIKNVAEDAFEPMRSTLKILDLAHANISLDDLNALMQGLGNCTTNGGSSNLIVLSLAHLGLESVPYEALSYVRNSLVALSLFGNYFGIIPKNMTEIYSLSDYEKDEFDTSDKPTTNHYSSLLSRSDHLTESPWATFPEMPYLAELDLRRCDIDFIDHGTFKNLRNLKSLNISDNNILVMRSFAFVGLTNLAVLHISNNGYVKLKGFNDSDNNYQGMLFGSHTFAHLYSLQTLNLGHTMINPSAVKSLSKLPKSLIELYLHDCGLSRLMDGIFAKLTDLQILDLSNNFGFGSHVTAENFKGLDMVQELHMAGTSLQSLGVLEKMSSLRFLNVTHNNIDRFGDVLKNFPLLEYLDVSHNYIHSWKGMRAFQNSSKLQTVHLESNSLTLMSEAMIEDFKSLSNLTLANNNFVCNCGLKDFMKYLVIPNDDNIQNRVVRTDYRANGTTHVCTDASLFKTVAFADTDEYCVESLTRYWLSSLQHGIYISVLVLVFCMGVGGLIYWNWWYIRYVAVLLKNATVLSMINVENCEDRMYIYDIFVSYSDENRNWVIEELIPNIEGPEAGLSICLHERDFQVGVGILENIITGMDQSRTILLIISRSFLKSQWCQFEMHMAQHRLLETCREELVLVFLDEIPKRKRPKILRYLMMVKTYIVWPKNSEDTVAKKLFWKRLRRAITTNKARPSTDV